MSDYRLEIKNPIPLVLLIPKAIDKIKGVNTKKYPTVEEALSVKNKNNNSVNLFFGSFKTYGGTENKEKTINGLYVIEDTAVIETWYRPDITSNCRIARASDNTIYEVMNEPEDINQRHQFLKFKVRRVKGGA